MTTKRASVEVMKLAAAVIVLTAGAIAWRVNLVPRVQRVLYEYEKHDRFDYSLAFFAAPNIELAPSTRTSDRRKAPGECLDGCLYFNVYSDPLAADVKVEFDDGAVLQPKVKERLVVFDIARSEPTEVWLTWKPQVYDPGVGDGFIGCGQSLTAVGARPEHRDGGRVGIRLALRPRNGELTFDFLGERPFVP